MRKARYCVTSHPIHGVEHGCYLSHFVSSANRQAHLPSLLYQTKIALWCFMMLLFKDARLSCFRAIQYHSAKQSTARSCEPSSSPFSAFDLELLSSNRIHLLLCFLRRSQVRSMFLLLTNNTGGWAYALSSVCRIMPRAISRSMLLWSYYLKEAEYECNG